MSHVRNHLTAELTRALMCLGVWDCMGYVDSKILMEVSKLPDVEGSGCSRGAVTWTSENL